MTTNKDILGEIIHFYTRQAVPFAIGFAFGVTFTTLLFTIAFAVEALT